MHNKYWFIAVSVLGLNFTINAKNLSKEEHWQAFCNATKGVALPEDFSDNIVDFAKARCTLLKDSSAEDFGPKYRDCIRNVFESLEGLGLSCEEKIVAPAVKKAVLKKIEFKSQDKRQILGLIDAGSSGSRLYIYEFNDKASATNPFIREIIAVDTKPGISSFAGQQDMEQKIADYFMQLIHLTEVNLKSKNINITLDAMPFYLLATAGMRNIAAADQEMIMSATVNAFASSKVSLKNADIIHGSDEALYAWTAANFNYMSTENIKGLIEIGGASAQVVFPTRTTNSKNLFNVNIKGKNHRLYIYSYQKNGSGLTKERIKKSLSEDQDKAEQIFNELCGTGGLTTKKESNFESCVAAIIDELKNDCLEAGCGLGFAIDAQQPKITVGTPFTYAGVLRQLKNDFINSKTEVNSIDQKTLKSIGSELCQKSDKEIAQARAVKNEKFAASACWQSALAYAWFYGNIGLSTKLSSREYGLGLSFDKKLLDTPEPGPQFPVGFILFHLNQGSKIPYMSLSRK